MGDAAHSPGYLWRQSQARRSVFYNYQIFLGLPLAEEVNVGAGAG